MGFDIRITDSDRKLLDKLRNTPHEVFGATYAGYLFFLVGRSDEPALQWLRSNLTALDSLTRQYIAFALFAAHIPLRLQQGWSSQEPRFSRLVGRISPSEVRFISQYARSGKFGWIEDNDYVIAMSYGADTVARQLGVLEHLPCIVCLDAFGSQRTEVISLAEDQLPGLLSLLRSAVDKFLSDPRSSTFREVLGMLSDLESEHSRLNNELDAAKVRLKRSMEAEDPEEKVVEMFRAVDESVRQGSYKLLMGVIECISKFSTQKVTIEIDEPTGMRLKGYARTIAALQLFESEEWPLSQPRHRQLQDLVEAHVLRLLPELLISPADLQAGTVRAALEELRRAQNQLLSDVLQKLPAPESVTAIARNELLQSQKVFADRIQTLESEILLLKEKALRIEQFFKPGSLPSLREAVAATARARGAKHFATALEQTAGSIFSKFLEPENVIKFLKAISGTP